MASSRGEGPARASPANGCPALRPAPNIPRVPHAAPCWPSARDFSPNTIGTTAATPLPSPRIAQLLPSTGSTSCSAQTAVPATRQPAQLHAQVSLRNIPQHSRHDAPIVERFAVRAHRVFAARSARNIVVSSRRKDFLCFLLQQFQRHGHRQFSAAEPERIYLQLALRTRRHRLRLL